LIIDEKALIEALDEGIIAGVALDTFEEEPPSMDSPLFKLDNVITTPHIAGVSQESFIRMGITATEMVFKVLEGKINEIDLHAIVNPTVVK
jgi:D-3-phosphoglycerate dehydrogenase